MVKYNNNVYLSATIDKIDEFEYYSKDIRTMIELKYLCDYQIHVPIFNDDPTNKNICSHLLKNYRNVIIYCNSKKEGNQINKLMNELQLNSAEYIDCDTSKKKRNIIIEKYKNSEIAFLINVRILVEGFDAPITKGVCFLHLPTNKTTLIQIIGRCLRLHSSKTIANIILPFSSNEDEKSICNFLKVIAKNDSRICQSFKNKKLGGYINIENSNEDYNNDKNENIEFKYNMIYNSLGILQNREEIWMKRLEEIKNYIDVNNKRPSKKDKNKEIQSLSHWICTHKKNYKKNIQIMKNENIRKYWKEFIEKYKQYFLSNNDEWLINFNNLKKYIDENNKRPSSYDKNKEIKILGKWVQTQKSNQKNKEYIIKNLERCHKWNEFITSEMYKKYFLSNEEVWLINFNNLKKYIDENKKRPSRNDKNKEIKLLSEWEHNQITNYKNKDRVIKNPEMCNKWNGFITSATYKKYFLSNEDEWLINFNNLKKYINENSKIPSINDENKKNKKLDEWVKTQKKNYKNKNLIMKNLEIYNKWHDFVNDPQYKKYFKSNVDEWNKIFQKVIEYINTYNERPSSGNKIMDIQKLASWIYTQNKHYKTKKYIMLNEEIYKKWCDFINDSKYKKYF